MPGWGVVPTIRVANVQAALVHYRDVLAFAIEHDDPENVEDVAGNWLTFWSKA